MAVIDAILEVFIWIGFGGAVLTGIISIVVWAMDGTWLEADAIVDHDDGAPIVRWFDVDGDANSAEPSEADAARLAGEQSARIWYRHGWHGRMRLSRRPHALTALWWASAALVGLGVVALVTSWVMLFVRG